MSYSLERAYEFTITRFKAFDCNAILSNMLLDGQREMLENNGYKVKELDNAELGCRYLIYNIGYGE